jgi:redox-sensing transcriptional repressor
MSLYRRLLISLRDSGSAHIYSHQLARLAVVSAAQVRRDMMAIGYSGSPNRGYEIEKCIESIGNFLDAPTRQDVALVGLGNLGRAVLSYFSGRRPRLAIVAAFDKNPAKVDVTIEDCHCFHVDRMAEVIADLGIEIAIVTVPAEAAQAVADTLVAAGVKSLISFAPVRLQLPDDIFVEDVDIAAAVESAAYFARLGGDRLAADAEAGAGDEIEPMVKKLDSLLAGAPMRLEELASKIGARVVTPRKEGAAEISHIYAGDRVSDLLNQASDKTLLVSNLASLQMVRIAELMDVPGICFVNDICPDDEIVAQAKRNGTMIVVSPIGVFETCGLIYQTLAERGDLSPAQRA